MPTYRYRCEGCGEEFEVWQSITDDALTTHDGAVPDGGDGGCGGHLVKVLTPAGIVLKGSGFYKTDNRGGRAKSPSGSNGEGSKDSTSKDSSSSKEPSSSKDSSSQDSSSKSDAAKKSGSSSDSKSPSSSSS